MSHKIKKKEQQNQRAFQKGGSRLRHEKHNKGSCNKNCGYIKENYLSKEIISLNDCG